jgi:hypothetical protein
MIFVGNEGTSSVKKERERGEEELVGTVGRKAFCVLTIPSEVRTV